ncbi:MAG: beta-galactosidase trimerization domain-containing protein, partial [Armatimonadetes bacterium]|nr:beta-galactosidase trimerization domain-containing protein [Armatimonadota bacterium]
VAREGGIDGIMVDMLFTAPPGGDYSPWTVKAFTDRFGVEPPRQEAPRNLTWQRWVDFQAWTREEVMLDVTEALHAVNPEIACIWNQTVGWIFTGRSHLSARAGQCADGLLEEMGWEVSHSNARWRPFAWPLQSAWQSLFLHCRTPYGQMWHLNGFYTKTSHEALSYSMFGNGIAPGVVTGGNWEFMQAIWGHIKPCESHMARATLVPWAALHFSENALLWYANARGDETRNAYIKNVFGLFQALVETHLPVAIITDDDLEDASRLKPYATVILPNSACLSDRQVAALTAYVQGGGGLVATFETGVFDENGTRRDQAALQDLLGVTPGAVRERSDWSLRTEQTHPLLSIPEIANGGDPGQGQRARRLQVQFFHANAERRAGVIQTKAGEGVDSAPLGGPGAGYSVLHTRTVGSGRAACFPPDIGGGYFLYNHPIARLLIERVVRWTAGTPPPLQTNAPLAGQTVCFRQGNEVVVHLINDNSSFGRAAAPNPENFGGFRDEVLPIYDLSLKVKGAFREALLLPEGKKLTVLAADGQTAVTVPRLDIHAMVVFTP